MTTQTIECWNCGQILNVRADKLSTARCGNCQQMIVRQESPHTPAASTYRREKTSQSRNFLQNLSKALLNYVLIGIWLSGCLALSMNGLVGPAVILIVAGVVIGWLVDIWNKSKK